MGLGGPQRQQPAPQAAPQQAPQPFCYSAGMPVGMPAGMPGAFPRIAEDVYAFMQSGSVYNALDIPIYPVCADKCPAKGDWVCNYALQTKYTAAQRAANHGERSVRLFEAGPVYIGDGPKDQRNVVAALVRPVAERHWSGPVPAYDAIAAKADLFALLQELDQPPERFQVEAPRQPHWHPGQAACLKLGPKVTVAHFGALHPRVLKALDVDGPVYGFELNLNALPMMKARATKTRPVLQRSDLTPIRRDFAFVVDEGVRRAYNHPDNKLRASILADQIRRADQAAAAVYEPCAPPVEPLDDPLPQARPISIFGALFWGASRGAVIYDTGGTVAARFPALRGAGRARDLST